MRCTAGAGVLCVALALGVGSALGAVVSPLGGAASGLAFDVLVLAPNHERSMFGLIAGSVVEGLRDLGLHAELRVSGDIIGLIREHYSETRQMVVLGTTNLAYEWESAAGQVGLVAEMLPPSAVLYQFEHITDELGTTQWMTPEYLKILSNFTVWDYSSTNVDTLARLGIRARWVPMGHSRAYSRAGAEVDARGVAYGHVEQDIEVLFFGTMTPHRRAVLDQVQARCGCVVALHHVFGEDLEGFLDRAKVVVNLRTWGLPGEFKISRLSQLFAGERFVVSEDPGGGAEADWAYFEAGYVRAPTDRVADVVLEYLSGERADERARIARRGRELFEARQQWATLLGPVSELLWARGLA